MIVELVHTLFNTIEMMRHSLSSQDKGILDPRHARLQKAAEKNRKDVDEYFDAVHGGTTNA